MRMVCLTLGLFILSFSTAAGDDFCEFLRRTFSRRSFQLRDCCWEAVM